jgi:unsaturated rhamnogalacturonyl hydrolase
MSSRTVSSRFACLSTAAAFALAVVGCSSSNNNDASASGGASGSVGSGGSTSPGGASGSGGVSGSGGKSGSGGVSGSGGATSSGGAVSTGGSAGSSGASGSGGAAGGGGTTTASGGAKTGGAGGGGAAGGTTGAGGAKTGGSSGSGGSAGVDGGSASGGSGGGTGSCPAVDFGTWPSGKGPADIGKLAAGSFDKSHATDSLSSLGGSLYAWTFAYIGSLQFTKLTGDATTNADLVSKFDCSQTGPDNSSSASVDYRAWGDLPLEIYLEKQDAKCKSLGMLRADAQWANTKDTAITPDARYWSDDMYMITGLQDFGFRTAQDEKYVDRAALTMVAYLQALQQSDGLMNHTKTTKAKWGRANGWFAAGMALLLQDLPTSNTNYATIMTDYKKMMDGLLGVQITSGTDAGAWHQVLDRTDAWAESSCTAMFTYALVTGLKNGWLSGDKYVTAAKNGWTALAAKTDSTGLLSQVCPGTGQASDQSGVGTDLTSQQNYYIGLKPASGDQHGQAALLWAAISLLRTDCPGMH